MAKAEKKQVGIVIPMPEIGDVYMVRRINLRLNGPQAKTMRQMTQGLIDSGATLNNGRSVKGPPDTIRWICENMK